MPCLGSDCGLQSTDLVDQFSAGADRSGLLSRCWNGNLQRRKTRAAKAKLRSASPLPHIDVPNLQDLLPQPPPDQGESPETPGSSDGGSGTTTTTPDDTTGQQPGNQAVSMREASMFLQFLLGGGA